jgi:hypothetical protein
MTLIAIRCQKSVNQITDYVSPVGLSSAYYNNDHFQKKIGIVSVKSKKSTMKSHCLLYLATLVRN